MNASLEHDIQQVVEGLIAGEPAIFPTDTVYGIGVAVGCAQDPEVLYDIKERDHGKPIAWLVGGVDDLPIYGKDVPDYVYALARAFWPGALTFIVKAAETVPATFRSPESTIALRMPDNETALGLIAQVGRPLATTSANISGQAPPKLFDELDHRLLEKVPLTLRDDSEKSGVASTVIDCTGKSPLVVRQGGISMEQIQSLIEASC